MRLDWFHTVQTPSDQLEGSVPEMLVGGVPEMLASLILHLFTAVINRVGSGDNITGLLTMEFTFYMFAEN